MAETSRSARSPRRDFLKQSTATLAGSAAILSAQGVPQVHAGGSETLKVGLIGCGGRGMGAAKNATRKENRAVLTAMADLFPEPIERAKKLLGKQLGPAYAVSDDHCFVGFDAFKQLLQTDVDVVLLATPPHFRPEHLAASIDAGKHVFCEKPVAVDPTGVRSVLETSERAAKKNLNIVSGLCWRYHRGVRETMKQIEDGAIGDIVSIHENYLTGTLWHRGHKPDWSEMEFQCRNWYYFKWLSGDHIVEQFIHSLDKALWLKHDVPPARCFGLGGRQVRTDPKFGDIYDHFAVCYEWEDGTKCFAYTRQMRGVFNNVEDYVYGTKGKARVLAHRVDGPQGRWRYRGKGDPSMYDAEHVALFRAIRDGRPINNGTYMSYSTLMAIIGREACYTGSVIDWNDAMRSPQHLAPAKYAWGPGMPVEVAMPGVTQFPSPPQSA